MDSIRFGFLIIAILLWFIEPVYAVSQFMTLPFRDADVRLAEGWVYKNPPPEACTQKNLICRHKALDFANGGVPFEVLAVADGEARYHPCDGTCDKGLGNYVVTRHKVEGALYYAVYAHLDSSTIPPGNTWTSIYRAQKLGVAGQTGQASGIHLHLEVYAGGLGKENRIDPYDIYENIDHYPDGTDFIACGEKLTWTACQPDIAPNVFTFRLDRFEVVRNGATLFEDTFSDGLPPPNSPSIAYVTGGTLGPEADGKLTLDSSGAEVVGSIPPGAHYFRQFVKLDTGSDPMVSSTVLGLADTFSIKARFDLIVPDGYVESYGIRLMDVETDVRLVVERIFSGPVQVRLYQIDRAAETVNIVAESSLDVAHDQIVLTLARTSASNRRVFASFTYFDAGVEGITISMATAELFRGRNFTTPVFFAGSEIPFPLPKKRPRDQRAAQQRPLFVVDLDDVP